MWQRFTERARKAVFYSQEEAQKFGEGYVSTEHFLLGLCRDPDNTACQVLHRIGVSPLRIQADVEKQLPRGDARASQDMTLTPRAKRVIDLAYDEARNLNHEHVGTEHMLLGLIREGDGLAGRVLAKLGVELGPARMHTVAVQQQSGTGAPRPPTPRPALGGPMALPAILTVARMQSADLLALILLTSPSEELTMALGKLNLDPHGLALVLEQRLFRLQPVVADDLPSVAGILDSASAIHSIFGQIANHPGTVTYQTLVEFGVTADAFAEAFPD